MKSGWLSDHVLDHDIVDLAYGIAVFKHLPGLVGMEMDLDEILVSGGDQAVALKMLGDVIPMSTAVRDILLIQKECYGTIN